MKAKIKNKKSAVNSVIRIAHHAVMLAIIPHNGNDYRPHLVRYYGIISIVLIVIGVQLGYNLSSTGKVLGSVSDVTISSLFEQTNQTRLQAGVDPLKLNDKLNQAAYLKAQDMFADQYWAHNAPDGTEPWKWFGDVGYNYDEAGENLAKNFSSTSSVVAAWFNSPEHKANMIKNSYKDVGFSVVNGELDGRPTSIVVALYGLPASGVVAGARTEASETSIGHTNILTQFAVALPSINPAVKFSLVLIIIAIFVAVLSHAFRHKLPKSLNRSWYRHHGLYKAVGMASLGLIVILFYSGGQI